MDNVILVEAQSLDGNYIALSDSHNFMPPGGHYRSLYIISAELKKGGKKRERNMLEALQLILNVKRRNK